MGRHVHNGLGALGSIISRRRWVVGLVALAALAAIAVGVAVYPRGVSSAAGAANVEPAKPAVWDPTPTAAFPLHASSNERYLVDRDGRPFLIVGDSPQALIVNLSVAQADRFFADRERAGFNALWINLLCDQYTGGRSDGTTYDGIAPFTRPGNLATPNPSYF